MLVYDPKILNNGDNIATTNYRYAVYPATWGSTEATSGVVDTSMCEYKVLSFRVATMTSPSVGYRIEGRARSDGKWAEVYTASKTAVMTINEIVNITEPMYETRVGFRCAAPTATAENRIYADLYLAEGG